MKKLIVFVLALLFAAAGCMEKKPVAYTRLGFFTPYQSYQEKLNGKVESVTELGYWAIPEGESYIKGAGITKKELDSIGYTYDFKAVFDADGDLVTRSSYDENGTEIEKMTFSKENNLLTRAEYLINDTIVNYTLISCDEEGKPYLYEMFNAFADTLIRKDEIRGLETSDTTIWQSYNYKSEPGSKYLFLFNDKGLLTGVDIYRKDGTSGSLSKIVYNDNGFQSGFTAFDRDNNVTANTTTTYEYDANGNWVKAIIKDDKGFVVIAERVYTYFE